MKTLVKLVDTDEKSAVSYGESTVKVDGNVRSRSTKSARLAREDRGIFRLSEFDIFTIRAGADVRGDSIAHAICRAIASKYHIDFGDLFDRTMSELAQWVGDIGYDRRRDTSRNLTVIERNLAAIRDHSSAMWTKFARGIAPKMSTGRGTRPKLTYSQDIDHIADSQRVNGKPMTTLQRELWRYSYSYERAESDIYSPYITSMGDMSDVIGSDSVHSYGGFPVGVPEIECAGLRRVDILERLEVANIPRKDLALTSDALASLRQSSRRIEVKDSDGIPLIHPTTGEPIKRFSQYVEWVRVRHNAITRGDKRGQRAIKSAVIRTLIAVANVQVSTDRETIANADYWSIGATHTHTLTCKHEPIIVPTLPVKDTKPQEDIPLMGWDNLNDCGHTDEDHPTDCPVRIARRLRIETVYELPQGSGINQSRLFYHKALQQIGATVA